MSREDSDCSYRPQKGAVKIEKLTRRTKTSQRTTRIDYTEKEVVSGSESEGVVEVLSVENPRVKSEGEESVLFAQTEDVNLLWTPNTFASRTTQLTKQVGKLAELTAQNSMAREMEQTNFTQIMHMMMDMRADDRKTEREREDRRIEREDRLRQDDIRRQERLLTTLKEAQPVVPQTITIQNHKLPEMKEGEDMELYVAMFEAALRSNNIPQAQWKNKLMPTCH